MTEKQCIAAAFVSFSRCSLIISSIYHSFILPLRAFFNKAIQQARHYTTCECIIYGSTTR